jgi:hypothetical protein
LPNHHSSLNSKEVFHDESGQVRASVLNHWWEAKLRNRDLSVLSLAILAMIILTIIAEDFVDGPRNGVEWLVDFGERDPPRSGQLVGI